jgi:hypothetical protein
MHTPFKFYVKKAISNMSTSSKFKHSHGSPPPPRQKSAFLSIKPILNHESAWAGESRPQLRLQAVAAPHNVVSGEVKLDIANCKP